MKMLSSFKKISLTILLITVSLNYFLINITIAEHNNTIEKNENNLCNQLLKIKSTENISIIKKEERVPYVLMVTSLDSQISSTPLLDIKNETIQILNESPFDAIAFYLIDNYSGQPIVNEAALMEKADQLKNISKKDIWVRVNINRIYQRSKEHPYYQRGYTKEDVLKLPMRGLNTGETAKISTPYFDKIKGMDIYDEEGTLSDFYKMWKLSLKFCKLMNSGIVLDFEPYNNREVRYLCSVLAVKQGKSIDEVVNRLKEIGGHLVDIVAQEYPEVTILTLFTYHNKPNFEKGYFPIPAYISQGMLIRAKEKKLPMKLIDGGEVGLGYISNNLDSLKKKIESRQILFNDWLNEYQNNFYLGGTITVWDDPTKIRGWVKEKVGKDSPFNSLEDFKPYIRELFLNYKYIWIYVPSVIDYNPFDKAIALQFNQKMSVLMVDVLKELKLSLKGKEE